MKEYESTIENYIDTVSRHIKWKNYHMAIGTELRDHIDDNITALTKQGVSQTNALKQTLDDMGNPETLGKQLNEVYQPEYNKVFCAVFLFFTILMLLLESYAHTEILHNNLHMSEALTYLLLGIFSAAFLFHCDFLKIYTGKKYLIGFPIILAFLCIGICKSAVLDSKHFINGILSIFPIFFCLFIGLFKNKKRVGFILSMVIIFLFLFLGIFSLSYSSFILLLVSGGIILFYCLYKNWFGELPKKIMTAVLSLFFIAGVIYMFYRKIDNIILNWIGYFPREYLKNVIFIGMNKNISGYGEQLTDYPLLLLIIRYGYIFLFLYIIFLIYVYWEMIHILKKQQTFIGKLIMVSVLVSFSVEILFSAMANLGIPFIKGYAVPFLDFHFEIAIVFVRLGIMEIMDCFGNYIFIEDVIKRNKLFDIENGKVILYYK